ncbi:unnamed protein product [Rhodiola kirilowii]
MAEVVLGMVRVGTHFQVYQICAQFDLLGTQRLRQPTKGPVHEKKLKRQVLPVDTTHMIIQLLQNNNGGSPSEHQHSQPPRPNE